MTEQISDGEYRRIWLSRGENIALGIEIIEWIYDENMRLARLEVELRVVKKKMRNVTNLGGKCVAYRVGSCSMKLNEWAGSNTYDRIQDSNSREENNGFSSEVMIMKPVVGWWDIG